jgi:hypothetical protein
MVKSFNLYEISVAKKRVITMATRAKKPSSRKNKLGARDTSEGRIISKRRPISELGLAEGLAEGGLMGTNLPQVVAHLGNQLCSCMFLPEDAPVEEVGEQVHGALLTVMRLAPRNELEAMLAVQAIAAHNAAMECMRRAMIPNRTLSSCDLYLKHAEKLFRIFKDQAEVISRNQRDAPQLTAGNSESQPDAEQAQPGAEGEDDAMKAEQLDNLCDLQAIFDKKKAS